MLKIFAKNQARYVYYKRHTYKKIVPVLILKSVDSKGTFGYHMTLRERVCSNRQSYTVTWGAEVWPNRHITFIMAEKA